ncbi:hypothetical protein C0431_12310 [bacterium]|nr:hypothetical protein [bacterium]
MPVSNTRELVPFVNLLEEKMEKLTEDIGTWIVERQKIAAYGNEIADVRFRSTGAFTRAEEALTEIGNATSGAIALRGQRLKKTIEDLKREVRNIAEEAVSNGGGGGGAFFDERITKEINNAIAGVSALVPEGLKLDARLQELADLATNGGDLGNKEMVIPITRTLTYLGGDVIILNEEPDTRFIQGEVGFATETGGVVLTRDGKAAVGKVQSRDGGRTGEVTMPDIDLGVYQLFIPAEVAMQAWPREALEAVMGATISRTSDTFKQIAAFDAQLTSLIDTVKQMQGERWTADVTLMKNKEDIIRESITPKGLQIDMRDDGKVNVAFSYSDHPNLSHFVLERMDENQNWVPYDGDQGIVPAE